MRISDWSSDVCSSDLEGLAERAVAGHRARLDHGGALPVLAQAFVVGEGGVQADRQRHGAGIGPEAQVGAEDVAVGGAVVQAAHEVAGEAHQTLLHAALVAVVHRLGIEDDDEVDIRSEEHTSELQSLMRISYAVFCLKK